MQEKSQVEYLKGLYRAMFVDIARCCPHLRVDCERDYSRLLSIIAERGIRFFLIDLPAMGKHFDKCLATGRLTRSNLPHSRSFRRGGCVPRHFKGLYLSVFDESGVLRIDFDPQCVKFLRQIFFCSKRFRLECKDEDTFSEVSTFFEVDRECRLPTLDWDEDVIDTTGIRGLTIVDPSLGSIGTDDLFPETIDIPPSISIEHSRSIQLVGDIVSACLGRFEPTEWKARHGPGAVSDLSKETKYRFPNWPEKLERIFPMADMAFANYQQWVDMIQPSAGFVILSNHEPPSKLIAVPKTLSGPRLIASEPTAHLWCQQVIRDFLMESVSKTPIGPSVNFRSQEANGSLALAASHSESHATIDLSAASDRISCWLVERLFRANSSLIDALHAVRTRYICNEIDRKSPRFHKLRKFTTMGSAVTFPVQTYIFAIIAIGTVLFVRDRKPTIKEVTRLAREVRVFGDDIIVPTDCWPATQEALRYLGLKVNPNKTFGTGKFRESCGIEAYDGDDVTKVSVLTVPEVSRPGSIVSCVDSHNNFVLRGYCATAEYIKSTVQALGHYALPLVRIGSGTFGWYHHLGDDYSGLKKRWNPHLQRVECLAHQNVSSAVRRSFEGSQMLLQYFTEVKTRPFSKEERLGHSSVLASKLRRRWVEVPAP